MSEQILPSIRYINGHPYIRVRDLANAWYTTTSTILATGKPHQIPAKYRRMIDREAWVDVEGLRIRLESMKPGSNLSFQLKQLVDRFPKNETHVDESLGPQVETIHMKEGSTTTITRCFIPRIDYPSQEEIQVALDNKQVLWRYKNKRIQVLAQTLSSFLDTRTSSLLAVNKKQGVPGKFIHRAWKRTWVDLEGLKQRVAHTEHGSALLKGLKQVVEILDDYKTAYKRPLSVEETEESASVPKPEQKLKPVKPCDLAVEANKRAVHNTERLNKLTRDEAALENLIFKYRDASSIDLGAQSKRLDMLADRLHRIEAGDKQDKSIGHVANERAKDNADRLLELETRVNTMEAGDWKEKGKSVSLSVDKLEARIVDLEDKHKNLENERSEDWAYAKDAREYIADRVYQLEEWRGDVGKQAAQVTVNQTLLGDLNTRLGRLATQTDRLDTKTEGLVSRVSVVEDTSKWLSWMLAGVIGVRFLGFTLHWLRRK